MSAEELLALIDQKKSELDQLVALKENLQDEEVYKKSWELDTLVVSYMKKYGRKSCQQKEVMG